MPGNKTTEDLEEFGKLAFEMRPMQSGQSEDKVLCQGVEIEELNYTIEVMKDNPINIHEEEY